MDLETMDLEGHHTAKMIEDDDCDHGPCTGYEVKELGLTVYLYQNDPTRISFYIEQQEVNKYPRLEIGGVFSFLIYKPNKCFTLGCKI